MVKRISWFFACLLWTALLSLPVSAGAIEAAVVLSKRNDIQSAFFEALGATLATSASVHLVDAGSAGEALDDAALKRADVVIAVGAEAADLLAARSSVPILAVLISSQNLRALQMRHPRTKLGGIVLDQPLARHMRLIHATLPKATRVGVLLGPQSVAMRPALLDAGVKRGLTLNFEQIDDTDGLLPALERLLESSDVILAVPDPVAYSASTARPILLTTYRYRRPLIGYSQAYVTAGAIAAVYSAPADIARQVAEWLVGSQTPVRIELPTADTPRYFSVGVNQHVARSLMVPLPDSALLADMVDKRRQP
ncbi:ABC transporter substrate-binding protein [Aromatoleum diolicum]|uniref:ABC transporter substrate-binding protein n=1 Tax=Aromatoleum diolicum TaxID=75796 RepID=A0ABX1QD52_9RHOO|nr:ABC transporter substrate binding protein [Aromatoleum diolicum]NMG75119.1 hypothetical protein [Aromatoleum diolicum]